MDNSEALRQAAQFERTIPAHLKSDALLQGVVQQLAQGGKFSAHSWRYIDEYRQVAAFPMTAKQYSEAMQRATA